MHKTYFGRLIAMTYPEYGLKTRVGFPPVRKLPLFRGNFFCFIFQKFSVQNLFQKPRK